MPVQEGLVRLACEGDAATDEWELVWHVARMIGAGLLLLLLACWAGHVDDPNTHFPSKMWWEGVC
jgi:hypothetical protein